MPHFSRATFGLALPALFLSQAAWADLTPSEVWGNWRNSLENSGYTVNATENMNGPNLTVGDIQLTMPAQADAAQVAVSLGTLTFNQKVDGTVEIVMPGAMPINVETAGTEDEEAVKFTLTYSQSGHMLMASGTPQDITYDYSADSVGVMLDQLQVGAESYGAQDAKVDLTATDVKSVTSMQVGEMGDYTQTGSIAALTYDVFLNNPEFVNNTEESNTLALKGSMSEIVLNGDGAIPLNLDTTTDMAAMLRAGFDVSGEITFGPGELEMAVTDPEGGDFTSNSAAADSMLAFSVGPQGIRYAGSQSQMAVNVKTDTLPFPLTFGMDEGSFDLAVPIASSEDPQDFSFDLKLADFMMSEMIWAMFDPEGQLPHDPTTLELGLSGEALVTASPMDPATRAQSMGEVQTLSIDTLRLDAVGAELEGSGSVTLENDDMATYGGFPKPVGTVNLMLNGANALLDKLIAMGVVPNEQAMGARMMLGVFAVPGETEDSLTSAIEFTEDGQILANGKRVK